MLIFLKEIEKMLITELKRRYKASDLYLEAGNEKAVFGREECEKRGKITVYREIDGESGRATLLFSEDLLYSETERKELSKSAAKELSRIVENSGRFKELPKSVLAVGLGNRSIASDSQGFHFLAGLEATLYLEKEDKPLFTALGGRAISKLFPTTEGESGIDPVVQIRALARELHPDMIVVADALCTASREYLGSTLQLSDAGIVPGSGIGRAKGEISTATTGIYTVVMGVPTVIRASTFIFDALEAAGVDEVSSALEKEIAAAHALFVSPKNADSLSEGAGKLMSESVRIAFKII